MTTPPITNCTVPNCTLITASQKQQTLSDLRGHYVVLYFYPKDKTPGCTLEAMDFRDHYPEFQKRKAVILGVSRDNLSSHQKFKDFLKLPFDLVSDVDERLCVQFEVLKLKKLFMKQYRGIERSTFLIDPEGKLIHTFRNVKVRGHAKAVLAAIDAHLKDETEKEYRDD